MITQNDVECCQRKNSYPSLRRAVMAAKIARQRSRHKDIVEYRCSVCHYWHIGHNAGRSEKEMWDE